MVEERDYRSFPEENRMYHTAVQWCETGTDWQKCKYIYSETSAFHFNQWANLSISLQPMSKPQHFTSTNEQTSAFHFNQ